MPSPREFRSPLHPPIPLDEDSGYWTGTIELDGESVPLSIYVDSKLSDATLSEAAALVANLAELRRRGRDAIRQQKDGDTVRYFFEFHQEELPDVAPPQSSADDLVTTLKLVGIGIHQEDAPFTLVLDFSFGREHSDELLAVKFSPKGEILVVSHES